MKYKTQITQLMSPAEKARWYHSPDLITGLRRCDGTSEISLPRDMQAADLGKSRSCMFRVDCETLSAKHARLERRAGNLHVTDLQSRNGTYYEGRRIEEITIVPGTVITFATASFIAMNDEMKARWPEIAAALGNDHTPTVEKYLVEHAMRSHHLLLHGKPDCGQEMLIRATHEVSLRRDRTLMSLGDVPEDRGQQRKIIDKVECGTMIIPLFHTRPPLDAAFCEMLFSSSYGIRVIVMTDNMERALRTLPEKNVWQMSHIGLRVLKKRLSEIPQLMDRELTELRSSIRCSDLMPSNISALRSHSWPGNFVELRQIAAEIDLLTQKSMRAAAQTLGISKSSISRHLTKVGLTFPLLAGRPTRL